MTQQEFLSRIHNEGHEHVFDGDITGATEPLFYTGPLTIHGDIESGTMLLVEGDVKVDGSVFDVALTSTGNVSIRDSFTGAGKGKIVCGMDVSVRSVSGQSIVAKGNIHIGVEALNADLHAYNRIDAGGARIVGGKSEASNEIIIRNLGSEEGRLTKVYLGNRKKLLQRINDISKEERSLNERLPKIVKCIYRWNRIKIDNIVLSNEQEVMLDKLRVMRDTFPRQAELFKKEVAQLNSLLRSKEESSLVIRGSIFENVLVDINGNKEVTDRCFHTVKFIVGLNSLVKTAL